MTSDDALDAHERMLIEAIKLIQEEHRRQLEPYVKRLARLREMRPRPIEVPIGQLEGWKLK